MAPPSSLKPHATEPATACYTILYEGVTLNEDESEDHFSAPIETAIKTQKENSQCYIALVSERDRSTLPDDQRKLVNLQVGTKDLKKFKQQVRRHIRQDLRQGKSVHVEGAIHAHGELDGIGRHRLSMTKSGGTLHLSSIERLILGLRPTTANISLSSCFSGLGTFFGYRHITVTTMGAQNEITNNETSYYLYSPSIQDPTFSQRLQSAHENDFGKRSFIQYYSQFSATSSGKIVDGPFPQQAIEVVGNEALQSQLQDMKLGEMAKVLFLEDDSSSWSQNHAQKADAFAQQYRGNFKVIIARAPQGSQDYWKAHRNIELNRFKPTEYWINPYYDQWHRIQNTRNPLGRDYKEATLISPKEALAFYKKHLKENSSEPEMERVFDLICYDNFKVAEPMLPQLLKIATAQEVALDSADPLRATLLQEHALVTLVCLVQDHNSAPMIAWLQKRLDIPDQDPRVQVAILTILQNADDYPHEDVLERLKPLLRHPDRVASSHAAKAFTSNKLSQRQYSEKEIKAFQNSLQDAEIPLELRLTLARNLLANTVDQGSKISFSATRLSVDFLISYLNHPQSKIRALAMASLRSNHARQVNALVTRKLKAALESERNPRAQLYLASLWSEHVHKKLEDYPLDFWLNGLSHENYQVKFCAFSHLIAAQKEALQGKVKILLPLLEKMDQDGDQYISSIICKLLERLDLKHPKIKKILDKTLKHPDQLTRLSALTALEKIYGLQKEYNKIWKELFDYRDRYDSSTVSEEALKVFESSRKKSSMADSKWKEAIIASIYTDHGSRYFSSMAYELHLINPQKAIRLLGEILKEKGESGFAKNPEETIMKWYGLVRQKKKYEEELKKKTDAKPEPLLKLNEEFMMSSMRMAMSL